MSEVAASLLRQELQHRSDGLVVLESTLMLFINLLAFIGNLMVCWAVYRNRALRTIPNIYVVTLAISDALMAVLCMPLTVVLLITGEWPSSSAVCHFQGFFCFFCALYSLLLMTVTAVNRYFRVVRPNMYRKYFKVKPTVFSVAFITLLAAIGAGLSSVAHWAKFVVHYGKVFCFMEFDSPEIDMGYIAFLDVFYIAVPIGIITFAYYKIFTTIKKHNKDMRTTRRASHSLNVEEVKITKVLFAAVLGFILCWGPIAVIDMVDSYTAHKLLIPREVFLLYIYLGFGSCSLNPVIYGVMNRAFRAEFLRVLTFWRKRSDVEPERYFTVQESYKSVTIVLNDVRTHVFTPHS